MLFGGVLLVCRRLPSPRVLIWPFSCVWRKISVVSFCPYKDTKSTDLGSTLVTLFNLNYILKGPTSKKKSSWELGLQCVNLRGHNSVYHSNCLSSTHFHTKQNHGSVAAASSSSGQSITPWATPRILADHLLGITITSCVPARWHYVATEACRILMLPRISWFFSNPHIVKDWR